MTDIYTSFVMPSRTSRESFKAAKVLARKTPGKKEYTPFEVEHLLDKSLMEEAMENILIDTEALKKASMPMLILLLLSTDPHYSYRGTAQYFLQLGCRYLSEDNINNLNYSLQWMASKGMITYTPDPSDNLYFSIGITAMAEKEMGINSKTIQLCKKLGRRYNIKQWTSLYKTWIGVQLLEKGQPLTASALVGITGMTRYECSLCLSVFNQSKSEITKMEMEMNR